MLVLDALDLDVPALDVVVLADNVPSQAFVPLSAGCVSHCLFRQVLSIHIRLWLYVEAVAECQLFLFGCQPSLVAVLLLVQKLPLLPGSGFSVQLLLKFLLRVFAWPRLRGVLSL